MGVRGSDSLLQLHEGPFCHCFDYRDHRGRLWDFLQASTAPSLDGNQPRSQEEF